MDCSGLEAFLGRPGYEPFSEFSRKQEQTQRVQMMSRRGEAEGCFQVWQETGQEGQQGTSCRDSVKSDWDSNAPAVPSGHRKPPRKMAWT